MPIDAEALKTLIDHELVRLTDVRVLTHIRGLLVEPKVVLRDWDYGEHDQQYPCWGVLDDDQFGTGIAYCESGFGPRCPWGLVWLRNENPEAMSIGMDSGWFPTFMEAFFDSFSSTTLPIYRVFKTDSSGARTAISSEGSWEETWKQVEELREADPASRYDCNHSIVYGAR